MQNNNVSMEQLKLIQDKITEVQQSTQKTVTSSDNSLSVTVNGRNQVVGVTIIKGTDTENIERLLPSMINEAIIVINQEIQQKIGPLASGLMR